MMAEVMYGVRVKFFLFSSTKIDVKAEYTSDDRKLTQACKASIMPTSFSSMTNNIEENIKKKKGGPKRRQELMIDSQMFSQMATLTLLFATDRSISSDC